jgi:TonB family protein
MKFAICCWLLVVLAGTTALAQTHPKYKRSGSPIVVHKNLPQRVLRDEVESYPLHMEEYLHCELKTAVAEPFDSTRVYAYVEQMPTLNGQPIMPASKATIEQYLVVPLAAPDGRMFVGFEISKTGSIHNVRILKGLRADLDSAVVTATRQLSRFTPGKQSGHVVAVSIVVPVTIPVRKQP